MWLPAYIKPVSTLCLNGLADPNTLNVEALTGLDISPSDIADVIERMFAERLAGRAWSTPKSMILPPDGRLLMTMMAACENPPVMAVKSLVMNSANPEHGLPQINAQVSLTDARTGAALRSVDGNWVTETRTAALSLIAARRMAKPDSAALALVGTGVQGRAHLRALAAEFPLQRVFLVGRGRANLDRLAALALDLGIEPVECDAESALRAADITVTSISYNKQTEPFLDAGWVKPGSFSAVTDTFVPWRRETIAAFDRCIIDDLEQEKAMTARHLMPLEDVTGDLSGLLSGAVVGRQNNERTLFAFRGHALADLAAALLAHQMSGKELQI